ncbi:hypothetical protein Gpo141_00014209, partial [Globisporangium polare]
PTANMADETADVLANGYVVQEKLEETAHAELFLIVLTPEADNGAGVNDVPLRQVVLKRSPPSSRAAGHSPTTTRRDDTRHEVSIVSRLRELPPHANVVQYLGSSASPDSESDVAHVVMEYCPRGDLFSYLVARPWSRMTDHEALHVVLHLARGLQYLHGHNIAHRDLSLENVLVGAHGQFKICDFGLGCDASQLVAHTGFRVYYMAPELVSGALCDPKKADMWSLGVMLYVMLTGSPLVELASVGTKEFRAIRDYGCRWLIQLWQLQHLFVEPTLDLLTRLLHVDPALRCESAELILSHPAVLAAAAREDWMNAVM